MFGCEKRYENERKQGNVAYIFIAFKLVFYYKLIQKIISQMFTISKV